MSIPKRVVIVTQEYDPHADALIPLLIAGGGDPFRLHPADLPTAAYLRMELKDRRWVGLLLIGDANLNSPIFVLSGGGVQHATDYLKVFRPTSGTLPNLNLNILYGGSGRHWTAIGLEGDQKTGFVVS